MSTWQRLRLFISYQRYSALLLVLVIAACTLGIPYLWKWTRDLSVLRWGLLSLFLMPQFFVLRFSWFIATKWPRKYRATLLAKKRIASGGFSPASIERYCEDPCFRVVANEILRMAQLPKQDRRTMIARYKEKARQPLFLMTIDVNAPEPVRVDGVLFTRDSPTSTVHTHN